VKQKQKPLEGRRIIDIAAASAFDKKAEDVVRIDLTGRAAASDWFLICQADNPVHGRAIADAVIEALNERGTSPWHVEGYEQGRWILLDYSDAVIHIMLSTLRKYYRLELLWDDCPRQTLTGS